MEKIKLLFYLTCAFLVILCAFFIDKDKRNILVESKKNSFRFNQTKKLPDALIIGASKCGIKMKKLKKFLFYFHDLLSGTDTLISFIQIHPDIKAAVGEVNFFDTYYEMGFEWYR